MKQGNVEGYIDTTEIRKSFRSETDWLCWVKNLVAYQRIIL